MKDFTKYLSKIRTHEERETLQEEINLVRQALYKTSTPFEEVLSLKLRSWVSEELTRDLVNLDTEQRNAYLSQLSEFLNSLTEISLSVSRELSQTGTQRVSDWVRENLNKESLLKLEIEPSVLGGVILVYGGFYCDFSLRKKIEDFFAQEKNEILKILDSQKA